MTESYRDVERHTHTERERERERERENEDDKKSPLPDKLNQNLIRKFLFEYFNSVTL